MAEKSFARPQTIGLATKKRATRLRLQVPIFVRGVDIYGEEFIELTKTLDISASGAYLTSPRALPKSAMITLTVPAPSVSTSGLIPTSMPPIHARVMRQKEVGDTRLIAVQFTKPID